MVENRTNVRDEWLQTMRETPFPFPMPTSEPISPPVPTVARLSDLLYTSEGLAVLVTIVREEGTSVSAEPEGEIHSEFRSRQDEVVSMEEINLPPLSARGASESHRHSIRLKFGRVVGVIAFVVCVLDEVARGLTCAEALMEAIGWTGGLRLFNEVV